MGHYYTAVLTSAKHIFGDSMGDPVADEINRMLINSPEGLTRTQINNNLGRNKPSTQISRALGVLLGQGLVFIENHETAGRDIERWFSVKYRT